MDGIINLNKPAGITSYGAIRSLKKICQEKKMGHLGTLDPMATGVLPIFVGKMTKLIPYFNDGNKGYIAELTLGASSTTLDKEGELTECLIPTDITKEQVVAELEGFLGDIEQIPPMYSAIRQDGKRLYELARAGEEVERKPRKVHIFEITNIEVNLPVIKFEVICSKGTYIRTLAADLGERLGTAAYLSNLTRHLVGSRFHLDDAQSLDQLENLNHSDLLNVCMDPAKLLSDWNHWPSPSAVEAEALSHGNKLSLDPERIEDLNREEPRCFVTTKNNKILCVGTLEFSQELPIFYQPSKVLI